MDSSRRTHSLVKRSILVVEDDLDSHAILRLTLKNYAVAFARDVAEARELIGGQGFDIFILDDWLPDGNGVDLCRDLRMIFPDTPIIVTSAAGRVTNLKEVSDAGATHYLAKPIDPIELRKIVKDLLEG